MSPHERSSEFPCFGSTCGLRVGSNDERDAIAAIAAGRALLTRWHARFSRFIPDSELSRLNDDPREQVPVSPLMARLIRAIRDAGEFSDGLVDGTLLEAIERGGYTEDLQVGIPLARTLAMAPARAPARPSLAARWRQLELDEQLGVLRRRPGVRIDSGGLAKGLFADLIASSLRSHERFVVDCAGDLAFGGIGGVLRPVQVQSPFDGAIVHTLHLRAGGVATSGIGRRSWFGHDGAPQHHLLDPATGAPAFTGLAQVTALAPSALEAEVRAKAALLSGPKDAERWLPHGGVLVGEDGGVVVAPAGRRLSGAFILARHAGARAAGQQRAGEGQGRADRRDRTGAAGAAGRRG
jgi:thiamine biosynthesis lipoprotein